MKPPPITICCDTIPYRRGFVEVANIHPRCINLEAWDVTGDWPQSLTTVLALSDEAVFANTEIELTVTQARELAAALLAAADFASGEHTAPDRDGE